MQPGNGGNADRGGSGSPAGERAAPGSLLHGAVYAQVLAQELLQEGYSEHQVFHGSGIGPEILGQEKPVADFARVAAFFEHAAILTGNDLLGFQRGQQRDLRRSGLICYVGLASPTLHDFIVNFARYRRVFSDAIEADLEPLRREGRLPWYYNLPHSVDRRQHVEFAASGLIQAMRSNTGRRFCLERVTFRHTRSTRIAEFEQFFGCEVRFGTGENSFRFRAGDLNLPLMTADHELYSVLREFCEETLKRKARRGSTLIAEVERAITRRLAAGGATQDQVARDMGMSARTLSRRLAREDTTFFAVLDDLRKSLAKGYLRNSDLNLAETAYLLGYSGLGSFSGAFRRWTGQSPGQFRDS
ncbi:MAG: AraC family transcriptional regulator [Jhaorihella sp.]